MYDPARTEALLCQLFDLHFRLAPADEVNITPAQWTQVAFRIDRVQTLQGPWGELGANNIALIILAVSGPEPDDPTLHRRHRVNVYLPVYHAGQGNPARAVAIIEYCGPLRWSTFDDPTYCRLIEYVTAQAPQAPALAPAAQAQAQQLSMTRPTQLSMRMPMHLSMTVNPYRACLPSVISPLAKHR
jgi:hypothetical protein